jgi:hypothetical protein
MNLLGFYFDNELSANLREDYHRKYLLSNFSNAF